MKPRAFATPFALLTAAALFAPPGGLYPARPLLAQDDPGEPEEQEAAECHCPDFGMRQAARVIRAAPALHQFFGSGVRLGILVEETESGAEAAGVHVREVVEGSAAEEAGLAAGDIVVAIDGTEIAEDEGDDAPLRKLLSLIARHEPGDTVTVEYLRDGQRRTAAVEVEERGPRHFRTVIRNAAASIPHPDSLFPQGMIPSDMADHPELRALQREHIPRLRASMHRLGAELGVLGLRLAELNTGLGEYFGEERGVLVLEAPPAESGLGLEAGDVILSIDGRDVERPGHARRILASYAADEEAELEVLRHGERITVTARPGERRIDPES